ncbi:MAG: hypothetical protein DCC68_24745 [Planctomycetota bacterium]|nr:MAG: hypothetical protein DCC68_24745 [Planctomycetota bacterium]
MPIVVEAVYKNGELNLEHPLPFKENERVKITIEPQRQGSSALTYGLIGWMGDAEVVRRLALDPEFGVHESP